jgi:hypothetical protein
MAISAEVLVPTPQGGSVVQHWGGAGHAYPALIKHTDILQRHLARLCWRYVLPLHFNFETVGLRKQTDLCVLSLPIFDPPNPPLD